MRLEGGRAYVGAGVGVGVEELSSTAAAAGRDLRFFFEDLEVEVEAGVDGADGGAGAVTKAREAEGGGESGICFGLVLAGRGVTLSSFPSPSPQTLCGSSKNLILSPTILLLPLPELLPNPMIVFFLFLLPEARCSMDN